MCVSIYMHSRHDVGTLGTCGLEHFGLGDLGFRVSRHLGIDLE